MTHRRARLIALAAALVTVPLGLGARRLLEGQLANVIGVALWTVVVAALVTAVAPRITALRLAALAGGIGVAVELFQLTGLPQRLYRVSRWFGLVLGTSFQWADLPSYLLGAAVAGALLVLAQRANLVPGKE